MTAAVHRLVLVLLFAGFARVSGEETIASPSPFLPPSEAAAPATAPSPGYELVGMTEIGKETLLSITREADKSSRWIAVEKSSGEITVLRYDPKGEQAVIRAGEKELTLKMRKAPPVALPLPPPPLTEGVEPPPQTLPAPAPPAAASTPPPATEQQKETEARMLVTDLLDIGVQQRKAYEEARQKAAKEKAAEPPAAPATEQ